MSSTSTAAETVGFARQHLFRYFEDMRRSVLKRIDWYNTGSPHKSLSCKNPCGYREQQALRVA